MADHPFSNAGLGMFGTAEKMYAQKGMAGGSGGKDDGGLLGNFLAGIIGLSSQDKTKKAEAANPVGSVSPTTQYEPQTAFPNVLQQQYASPYIAGVGSAMPPPTTSLQGFMTQPYRAPQAPAPADPMAGFKTQNPFAMQPQATASGYHPVTDSFWGK
jgi:hypothetical protein